MTTSGTTVYQPSLGELTLYSYGMCGIRGPALLAEHMFTARMATNLMLVDWANKGPTLWTVDLQTIPLVAGTATYAVDSSTIMILDAYAALTQGSTETDRLIMPVSRSEYASYPNKTQQGYPTAFWFDRLVSPTLTLWPVPDGVSATYVKYYRFRQIQDANFAGGQNVEIPYRFLNAIATGLAFWLSITWAPDRSKGLKLIADESYGVAANQDVENVAMYISPQIGGYFRN